jgi:hypothetical protein
MYATRSTSRLLFAALALAIATPAALAQAADGKSIAGKASSKATTPKAERKRYEFAATTAAPAARTQADSAPVTPAAQERKTSDCHYSKASDA